MIAHDRRVVSLVPSVTETLLAWGVTPVGVTRFCEAPGRTDGRRNEESLTCPPSRRSRPDLVVMDKEENRAADAEALQAPGTAVHVTQVRSLDDVAPTLAGLAAAVGVAGPDRHPRCSPVVASSGAAWPAWVPIWRRPWMSISGCHLRLHPACRRQASTTSARRRPTRTRP